MLVGKIAKKRLTGKEKMKNLTEKEKLRNLINCFIIIGKKRFIGALIINSVDHYL